MTKRLGKLRILHRLIDRLAPGSRSRRRAGSGVSREQLAIAAEELERRTLLSSVTIVTHGFNSDADSWVNAMSDEVIARIADESGYSQTDVAKYELTVQQSSVSLTQESSESYDTAISGETVIRLDWGALSSSLTTSTLTIAEQVANYVFAGQTWIIDGSLHLIGHSRGASLITALANEFGERGVWVDQTTFLDAHPVDGDYAMNIPENVSFADGYWREGGSIFSFDGEPVSGAFNIELNQSHFEGDAVGYGGFSDVHSDVHLWYHATTDIMGGFDDSEETVADADAAYWFQSGAFDSVDGGVSTARNETGFAYSRIVGGTRPVAGINQDLGGNGARTAVNWGSATWPNIVELTVDTANLEIAIGDTVPVAFSYLDADSDSDLLFYFDVDRNPYNGNEIAAGSQFLQTGGTSTLAFDAKSLSTIGAVSGAYYVSAKVSDAGGRTRWAYAPQAIMLTGSDDHSNSSVGATMLPIDGMVNGEIGAEGDVDYFQFDAVAEATYRFSTSLTTLTDSTLTLFDTDGTTQLDFDDDSGTGFASEISWVAPTSGTFFLAVAADGGTATGTYGIEGVQVLPPLGGDRWHTVAGPQWRRCQRRR